MACFLYGLSGRGRDLSELTRTFVSVYSVWVSQVGTLGPSTDKENMAEHVTLRQHFTETISALSQRKEGATEAAEERKEEGSVRNFLNGFGNSDDRLEMGAARKRERLRYSDGIVILIVSRCPLTQYRADGVDGQQEMDIN